MGRNKLPPEEDRSERIYSRVTADELELIKSAAEIVGKSVSDLVRELVVDKARRIVRKHEREDE